MRKCWLGCALLLVLLVPAVAQDIPDALKGWQGWVLHDRPQHDCPFLTGSMPAPDSRRCLWPQELKLEADKDGGRFRVRVDVDAESWLDLPGDSSHWPQGVTDRGKPVLVHERNGTPTVHLDSGSHELAGRWEWSSMPNRLALPDDYGLLSLRVDGKLVPDFRRSGRSLTLGESPAAPRQADSLSLKVFRRLDDGLPPTLSTRLQLDVSGRAREVSLGPVLPQNFVATRLDTPIPARLDGDGHMHLQVRPGHWQITLAARGTQTLGSLDIKLAPKPWPQHEIWSYADNPDLRQTRVEGHAVDAAQAGVPGNWRDLPAFAVGDDQGLQIKPGARAGQNGVREKIRIQRELWLAFDGDRFTASDHVTGTLDHPRRLSVQPPWVLERASVAGDPLLVGKGTGNRRGVELRQRHLQLDAGLELPRSALGRMPLAGWEMPLDNLTVDLQLPPGYRLLGAPGADQSRQSWVASWTLLDLFLVALIALVCGRLLGWPMALVALAYLVIAHGEAWAPYLTVLLAAAVTLLVRALPEGRLRRVTRAIAFGFAVLALLWALPFAGSQLRSALYPQLSERTPFTELAAMQVTAQLRPTREADFADNARRRVSGKSAPVITEEKSAMAVAPPAPAPPPPRVAQSLSSLSLDASPGPVQSGPGIPQWRVGTHYRLEWSGPVTPQQSMRLVIAPSWLVRLLRVLAVAALLALLARLMAHLVPTRLRQWRLAGGSAALLLMILMSSVPTSAQAAETPPQSMLDQLKQRLLQPPECAPDCALLANGQLQLQDERLQLLLQVQAEANVAVPMPDSNEAATLLAVRVDGKPAGLLRDGQKPLLRLTRGIHSVQLEWQIHGDDLRLAFAGLKPKRIQVHAGGWNVGGLDDARLSGDTITLVRERKATPAGEPTPTNAMQAFPPYVRLQRSLLLGTDWRVVNTVQRVAPAQAGFSVSLPLLPGEHPLGEHVRVRDGQIELSFSAGQQQASWTSRIEQKSALSLQAPPLAQRSETWQVRAASIWHVEAKGVPPQPADGMLAFAPLPGETLQLAVTRPEPASGSEVAMDKASVHVQQGERARNTSLALTSRSTRGGEHAIDVPADAQLTRARRDGQNLALALRDGHVSLPLRPGTQHYAIDLREARESGLVMRTPALDLEAPTANIHLQLDLPQDRWVLWTWGPQNGPAVLYWPQILLLVLVAWLLARFAPTPLRFQHWLLLGLGFSTFSWSAFALVAVWLILLGQRHAASQVESWPRLRFNLMQIGLAVLTALALIVLVGAVPRGLLGLPDMHVAGNGSSAFNLKWMLDQTNGELPRGGVLSLPLWCYKLAILAWALWLANALVGWLRWAFGAWSAGGYWRRREVVAAPGQTDANESSR